MLEDAGLVQVRRATRASARGPGSRSRRGPGRADVEIAALHRTCQPSRRPARLSSCSRPQSPQSPQASQHPLAAAVRAAVAAAPVASAAPSQGPARSGLAPTAPTPCRQGSALRASLWAGPAAREVGEDLVDGDADLAHEQRFGQLRSSSSSACARAAQSRQCLVAVLPGRSSARSGRQQRVVQAAGRRLQVLGRVEQVCDPPEVPPGLGQRAALPGRPASTAVWAKAAPTAVSVGSVTSSRPSPPVLRCRPACR